jgi:hypothetical protein
MLHELQWAEDMRQAVTACRDKCILTARECELLISDILRNKDMDIVSAKAFEE